MSNLQSEYLVFVDESGSPTMGNIDPQYPLFVLAFFIVKKNDYVGHITPAVQHFKFKHFGHDQVILHERDIRKEMTNVERKTLDALTVRLKPDTSC